MAIQSSSINTFLLKTNVCDRYSTICMSGFDCYRPCLRIFQHTVKTTKSTSSYGFPFQVARIRLLNSFLKVIQINWCECFNCVAVYRSTSVPNGFSTSSTIFCTCPDYPNTITKFCLFVWSYSFNHLQTIAYFELFNRGRSYYLNSKDHITICGLHNVSHNTL